MLLRKWYGMTIWNKIYKTEVLKTAYKEMDNFYCYMGEDIYSSFYIALFANSLASEETDPLYYYYWGRGVSTKPYLCLEEFRDCCNMSQISRRIREYLIKVKAWDIKKIYWENITEGLWRNCCIPYLFKASGGIQAVDMLLESWKEIRDSRDLSILLTKEIMERDKREHALKLELCKPSDAALQSFETGGIGMKYILKYIRAWGKYKAKMLVTSPKLKCPCCGRKIRTFVASNFIYDTEYYNPDRYIHIRQDVLCPECMSLPRHRILASWLTDNLDRSSLILYFALEECMAQWMKHNGVKCISADLEAPADLKIDIQKTGLKSECFDMVICNHVLEHVDDFRMALKEMYRILKPGGSLICSFPIDPKIELLDEDPDVTDPEERRQRFGQRDHKRVFGMNADVFLAEAGFLVEKISGEDYPENILPVIGPADYDMNYLFRGVK